MDVDWSGLPAANRFRSLSHENLVGLKRQAGEILGLSVTRMQKSNRKE
jgi:hypothetical protein